MSSKREHLYPLQITSHIRICMVTSLMMFNFTSNSHLSLYLTRYCQNLNSQLDLKRYFYTADIILEFWSGIRGSINHYRNYSIERKNAVGKSFSLYYNDLARWLFMTLAFSGILSTGWFGIPLIPKYFLYGKINIVSSLFALFSALGSIWGVIPFL